jgi:predicted flap endonuclease-1-like 5' DNA nuclease
MILTLDPLSKPVAITEILLLLALATFIGWLIGRWLTKTKIQQLKNELASVQSELEDCRNDSPVIHPTRQAGLSHQPGKTDNLKLIEGIGPKIEMLLNANGISTFSQLADSRPEHLNMLLQNAGKHFQVHEANTWPKQAQLARDGKWNELSELQERLDGGVE